MSEFLIKAGQLLLSLSILVVLHELGHFIPAKIFKTRVEKFYLFFDVKFPLADKTIGISLFTTFSTKTVFICFLNFGFGFWFLSTPTAFRLSPPLSISEKEIKTAGETIVSCMNEI